MNFTLPDERRKGGFGSSANDDVVLAHAHPRRCEYMARWGLVDASTKRGNGLESEGEARPKELRRHVTIYGIWTAPPRLRHGQLGDIWVGPSHHKR
jgi:hypothetical protein